MTIATEAPWYLRMRDVESRGSQVVNVGGLAGLAAARAEHQGQFWTPPAVARLAWSLFADQLDTWCDQRLRKAVVLEPCIGSGRLQEPADPARHAIVGFDQDVGLVDRLDRALRVGTFDADVIDADCRTVRYHGQADVAILNPPFGLHWDHSALEALPCTSYGRNGPHSSALSHRYVLESVARHAACVVAILPLSAIDETETLPGGHIRRGVWRLPATAFRVEGAEVSTWIGLWSHPVAGQAPAIDITLTEAHLAAALPVAIPQGLSFQQQYPHLRLLRAGSTNEPVITRAVTGNPEVLISRAGRRLTMDFRCGAVEAVVRNAVMRERLDEAVDAGEKRPIGLTYTGETALDIEVLCVAGDPLDGIATLARTIAEAGGFPCIDPALTSYLRRHHRWLSRMRMALSHVVADPLATVAHGEVQVTTRAHLPMAAGFGAAVVPRGTTLTAQRTTSGLRIAYRGATKDFAGDDITKVFQVASPTGGTAVQAGWRVVASSAIEHPLRQHQVRDCIARARDLGIDRYLTREYQWDDFIELRSRGGNALIDWDMGTGKARLAVSLALMGGRHNLIVVQSHLVDEMVREIAALGLAADLWQVIRAPGDLQRLRRINIITYSRLRRPVSTGAPDRLRWTYAGRLRNAIHTLICDEVQCLATETSDQTLAVRYIGGAFRFGLSGTPIRNYARNILPITRWLFGDGNVLQPYGTGRRPFCEPALATTALRAKRGNAVFADRFVVTEWVTNEFADTLGEGAKREVPRINNVELFHAFLAPLHKRRRAQEPAVRKYLTFPVPTFAKVVVDWDDSHLVHYLQVGEEFAAWYRNQHRLREEGKPFANLAAVLARIGAVISAANCPQEPPPNSRAYFPVTSKERRVIERTREHVAGKHRCILLAHRPATVMRLVRLLEEAGIRAIAYHGGIPIRQRNKTLYREFVEGEASVLVATIGSCQTGLNLWMADRVLFVERSWTSSQEDQAAARVLRDKQKGSVLIEYFHLAGSIDDYEEQMVKSKRTTAAAILDHGAVDHAQYLHLDTIIGRFVDDLTRTLNVPRYEVREYLSRRALAA